MPSGHNAAIVIGSSGGIGSAIVRSLIEAGWHVHGFDIEKPSREGTDVDFEFHKIDVADARYEQDLNTALGPIPHLRAVIYAAGIYDHVPLAECPANRLKDLLDVNVLGFARTVEATFRALLKSQGHYIVISSETALINLPFQIYGVTKGMLDVYAHSLRQELRSVGIGLTVVYPGAHETPLLHKSHQRLGEIQRDSAFYTILKTVRDRGQAIINKGGSDPDDVGRVVVRILDSDTMPARVAVHVSGRFRTMRAMPRWLRERILKWALSR